MADARRNDLGDSLEGLLGVRISSDQAILGATVAGSNWVMKALNPSSKIICNGIPDTSSGGTIPFKFEAELIITAPNGIGVADTWNLDINNHNDAIRFADIIPWTTSSATGGLNTFGDLSYAYTWLNEELPVATALTVPPWPAVIPVPTSPSWPYLIAHASADYQVKYNFWTANIQHARNMYNGITTLQSASANSDQGDLTGGIQDQGPEKMYPLDTVNGRTIQSQVFGFEDFANASNIHHLPRSYSGLSKAGGYSVTRLGEKPEKWWSQTTPVATQSTDLIGLANAATGIMYPGNSPHMYIGLPNGTIGPGQMNSNLSQQFFRGLAPNTVIKLTKRVGFEGKPFSVTTYSPFIMDSPESDELAMGMYSRLMLRVEEDMYPANFNRFEILGKAIQKIAPYITSMLKGALGGASEGIPGALVGMIGGAYDQYERNVAGEKRALAMSRKPPPRNRVQFIPEEEYTI